MFEREREREEFFVYSHLLGLIYILLERLLWLLYEMFERERGILCVLTSLRAYLYSFRETIMTII
jgi:hypothetical protein